MRIFERQDQTSKYIMDRSKINNYTVTFILILLAISAVGYLVAPDIMLNVVGISGTKENAFLVKTLAAALLSMLPPLFAVTRDVDNKVNLKLQIILGLVLYMFLSSVVDLYGYFIKVVNFASVPSIGFRVALGILLLLTSEWKK